MSSKNYKIYQALSKMFPREANADLESIANNKYLLEQHIKLIKISPYIKVRGKKPICNCHIDDTKNKKPLKFVNFSYYYKNIYKRWQHLLRCCYDKTYKFYPFFGAKGIKVSDYFLDSKKFCIWCLEHNLTNSLFKYDKYLIRKDKTKDFSPSNCYVIEEKEIHKCKNVSTAFLLLSLIKYFEQHHDSSVIYATFLTRYFMYDFDIDTAATLQYDGINGHGFPFTPGLFYDCVADETSCSKGTFLCRIHDSYLIKSFIRRPYDMLKPNYSISEEADKQGLVCYKHLWDQDHPDMRLKKNQEKYSNENINTNNKNSVYSDDLNNTYSDRPDINIYDENNIYS